MLNTYLNDLVNRMLDQSDHDMVGGYDSSKTNSWKALREAETLTDTDFIDNIIENIASEKNKKRRSYLYFTVGRICENKPYQKGLEFLIDRLDKETDKYIIASMLDRITWLHKSAETDLTNIFACLNHKTWQVKFSAISALKETNNGLVDDLMIAILEDEKAEKYQIENALNVIYNCGTAKCLNAVEKQTRNKSRIIKNQAKEVAKHLKEKINI
jgi:hypothetical protein